MARESALKCVSTDLGGNQMCEGMKQQGGGRNVQNQTIEGSEHQKDF